MNKTLKIIICISGTLLLLVLIAGIFIWNMMQKPLYQPGMVREGKNLRAPLSPPVQNIDSNISDTNAAGYWQVEKNIKLHYFSEGKGQTVLVIHGGPGVPNLTLWSGLKPLTDRYKFYCYDQRGCGESTRPVDKFSSPNYFANMQLLDKALGLGAQIADIERIRRISGQDKIILIGHSFGGFIASLYAAEFPEHVKAMVLVAPADVLVLPSKNEGFFELVGKKLPSEKMAAYNDYLKRLMDFRNIFKKSEQELVALNEEFVQYYAAVDPGVYLMKAGKIGGWLTPALYMSMGLRHDYREGLRKVTAPVLVIHGADDLQPEKESRVYTELFPNSKFTVIGNSTHFMFEQKPEEFANVVGKFFGEIR